MRIGDQIVKHVHADPAQVEHLWTKDISHVPLRPSDAGTCDEACTRFDAIPDLELGNAPAEVAGLVVQTQPPGQIVAAGSLRRCAGHKALRIELLHWPEGPVYATDGIGGVTVAPVNQDRDGPLTS